MCRYCVTGSSNASTDRVRVLDLLALIEHPDALPAEAVLRIASELLAWTGQSKSGLRCEIVATLEASRGNVT